MARRILLLITDLEIGGTPTVVRELATRLHRPPEVHIEVACLKRHGPVADQICQAGITVAAFNAKHVWHLPSAMRRVRQIVREHCIDTVFSFLIHANTVAALAARKLSGVRFFQSIQTTQPWPRWHWWVQGRIQQAAERIVVPSLAVDGAARTWSGIAAGRCVVISNAIDVAGFSPSPGVTRRVGFLGRLDPVKRVPVLLRAMARLNDEFSLHVFGDGAERSKIEAEIARLGLRDRVTLHGAATQPGEALRKMDVLVLPSIGEGFGLVLIEAMAAGVPVIASAAGGALDVVKHEHNGLLVPVGADEARGIAEAIRRVADDQRMRWRLIENGMRTVRERFTWDVVLPRYRELLGIA